MTKRTISQQGLDLIKHYEGCRLHAYKCPSGIWTIGYGSTYYANGKQVQQGDYFLNQQECEELLKTTVKDFEKVVNAIPALEQHQFDALVSFAFNVGAAQFNKSSVKKHLIAGDKYEAMKWLMRYCMDGHGHVLKGLERRRQSERELFLSNSLVFF